MKAIRTRPGMAMAALAILIFAQTVYGAGAVICLHADGRAEIEWLCQCAPPLSSPAATGIEMNGLYSPPPTPDETSCRDIVLSPAGLETPALPGADSSLAASAGLLLSPQALAPTGAETNPGRPGHEARPLLPRPLDSTAVLLI